MKNPTPCTFWLRGVCSKGASCGFSHEDMASTTLTSDVSLNSSQGNVPTPHGSRSDGRFGAHVSHVRSSSIVEPGKRLFRNLGGATVVYQDGASVKSVTLSSDYSTIQLSGLASTTNIGQIITFVTGLDFHDVDESHVRLKPSPNSTDQIAEVKVKDPTFAQRFIQRAGTNLEIQGKTATAAHLQRLDSDEGSESSAKRLQLNSVLCSWYDPSRIAWLHFGSETVAVKAVEFLNGPRMLRRRKLQAKYQPPPIHAYRSSQPLIHSVQVGNLDVETTQEDLRRFLRGREPRNIKMGPKSYMATPQEAALQVRDSLEAFGQLTDWDVSAEAPGTPSKATARFANPEDTRRAAAGLNGKKTSALGDTKLFVNTVTSVKFSILSQILNAVRVQLEEIRSRVWESTYVHIKVYDKPTHGIHTALRIFGGDRRAVSQAKSSVEKLLAGTIARIGDSLIRDPFFFSPDAMEYFQNLMDTHGVFIYRDLKRRTLRMYGLTEALAQTTDSLLEKAEELSNFVHTIVLTPDILRIALQGGFRRLVAVFGKEVVKLNITSSPKIITFQGSSQDFQRAHTIFLDTHNIDLGRRAGAITMEGTDEVCPVCWMEPEDPVSGACGHTYCRDCMAGQCSSAADGAGLPLRCIGASATCDHVFTLTEIQDTIPESVFENLLESSFTSHVRAQPEIFQYCPTPDCDRIYRSSTDGRIFLCDNCITPVCTACHAVAHDGITCTEAKELGSESEIAFAKWKQEQEDVKSCPKCKTVIEKTYGCNHMQCFGCKVHICWFCLDIFDTGPETYAHMQERHGGINNY